jgi:hypothetical protein
MHAREAAPNATFSAFDWLPADRAARSVGRHVIRRNTNLIRRLPRLVAELRERCTILSTPICQGAERGRGIVWLEPSVVAEIQYNEMMQGRLRDAVLRGMHVRS